MDLASSPFLDQSVLTAISGVGDLLTGATVDLYKAPVAVGPTTPVADYIAALADYSGYAQQTVTWLAVSVGDDGVAELVGTVTEFRPTGSAVGNTVWGFFVRKITTGELLLAGQLDDAPRPMSSVLDSLLLTIRVRLLNGSMALAVP